MRAIVKYLSDIRVWYGITGIVISIIAHEAFHLAAHMGNIEKISLFPNVFTVVEITEASPGVLPHDTEEAIAYSITALVLLLTIIDVYAISDSRDTRTVSQIINTGGSVKSSHGPRNSAVRKK